jgi:hypothetical protein
VVPFFALFHVVRFVAGWIVDEHTPLGQVPTVALGYLVGVLAVVAVAVVVFTRGRLAYKGRPARAVA